MIVRMAHPDDPAREVFVPVVLDRQSQTWVPAQDKGRPLAFEDLGDAIKLAHVYLLNDWQEVHEQVRLVGALGRHPGFDFENDGLDAGMVQRQMQALARLTEMFDEVLPRVLDAPSVDDTVVIADGLQVIRADFDWAAAMDVAAKDD